MSLTQRDPVLMWVNDRLRTGMEADHDGGSRSAHDSDENESLLPPREAADDALAFHNKSTEMLLWIGPALLIGSAKLL